jgi:hypothetical protein
VIFLFTKFTAGAWVVVVAVPLFMLLFSRVSAYYQRVGPELGLGRHPPKPNLQPVVVVVPVTGGLKAVGEGRLSGPVHQQTAWKVVSVVPEEPDSRADERERKLKEDWERWGPGVPLHLLRTEYASVVRPIVAFVDELEKGRDERVMVLIPVAPPRPAMQCSTTTWT